MAKRNEKPGKVKYAGKTYRQAKDSPDSVFYERKVKGATKFAKKDAVMRRSDGSVRPVRVTEK